MAGPENLVFIYRFRYRKQLCLLHNFPMLTDVVLVNIIIMAI